MMNRLSEYSKRLVEMINEKIGTEAVSVDEDFNIRYTNPWLPTRDGKEWTIICEDDDDVFNTLHNMLTGMEIYEAFKGQKAAEVADEVADEETYTNTDVTKIWVKTQKQFDEQTRECMERGYEIVVKDNIRVMEQIKDGTLWRVEIILDKNIKEVYCDEILWLTGSMEQRSHRAIYSNGTKYFAKWYGKYIEVGRGSYPYDWRTVEAY